jgi:hypothetical protein
MFKSVACWITFQLSLALHAPTEEQVSVKEERVKRTTYTTLCTGGLRDNCYGPITLPILPDWTSEAIEVSSTGDLDILEDS